MKNFNKKYLLHIAWGQALIATLGSLYFSEVRHFPPCVLCWWQRIFMYPLILIIPIGIISKDKKIARYVLALTTPGLIIAFYHNLLYYKIIPESLAPCMAGISCTTKYVAYLGFITIPFLSFCAFLVIVLSMLLFMRFNKKS